MVRCSSTSSTQHPSEVQNVVAHVLHLPMNKVVVQSPRMGGGFGGKETQAQHAAALAALAAYQTGRPVRVRFNRDQDMMLTGPSASVSRAVSRSGFDAQGKLLAVKAQLVFQWRLVARSFASRDGPRVVSSRQLLLHSAGGISRAGRRSSMSRRTPPFAASAGRRECWSSRKSSIALRGGSACRRKSCANETCIAARGETNTTHYGQEIEDNRIPRIWQRIESDRASS